MENLKTSDYRNRNPLEDWKLNRNVECRITLNKLKIETPEYETMEFCRMLTNQSAPKESTSSHTKDIHSNVEFVLDVLLNEILGKCEEKCKVCEEYVQQFRHHIIQAHSASPDAQTVFKCDICGSIYSSPSMLIRHRNTHSDNSDILTTPRTNEPEPVRLDSNNIYASFDISSVTTKTESVSSVKCEIHPHQPVPVPPMKVEWNCLKQEPSSESELEISNPVPLGIFVNNLSTLENNLKQECDDLECEEDLRDPQQLEDFEVPSFVKYESTEISTETAFMTQEKGSNDTHTGEEQSKGGTRDLITHKNPHSNQQPHKCDGREKCFNQLHQLTQQKLTHTGERPHKCDVCGKCYAQGSALTRHRVTHTGEKPFRCDVCGRGFQHKHHLTQHKPTHTGEKPHKCDVCGKCFAQRSTLTRHRVTHTGEKPFRCDECGMRFQHKHHLTQHKPTHTGEKPHKCDICGKCFGKLDHLTQHRKIHTGERPHKCDVCGKCFGQGFSLTRHKMTHSGATSNNKPEPVPVRLDSNSMYTSFDISSVVRKNESVSSGQCENHSRQPVTVLPNNFEWNSLKQELSSSHSQVEIPIPNPLGILQHMNHLSTFENILKQKCDDLAGQSTTTALVNHLTEDRESEEECQEDPLLNLDVSSS